MLAHARYFLLALVALSTQPTRPTLAQPGSSPPPAPASPKAAGLPYTPSLEPSFMDRSIDPCVDFYAYSCAGWMRQNPLPADQPRWDVYHKLGGQIQQHLWELLQQASQKQGARTPVEQKLGDYFAACMDEAQVEKQGSLPLQQDLATIAALKSKVELPRWLARAHLRFEGERQPSPGFGFGVDQDPGAAEQTIAWVDSGGLGLPDRDYYTSQDDRSAEIRRRYVEHIAGSLVRIGQPAATAKQSARKILALETELATAALPLTERRNPYNIYHKTTIKRLKEMTPDFAWEQYLEVMGLDKIESLNVTEPAFFAAFQRLIGRESLATWQAYLSWHQVNARAPYLSSEFARADFEFNQKFLRGVRQERPRWKRCMRWLDRDLGEALGQLFVSTSFSAEIKAAAGDMLVRIKRAMATRIEGLDWMSPVTKSQALAKLDAMRHKLGYPDVWRDYSSLQVTRGDFYGNIDRANIFEIKRQITKVGKPVDHSEWFSTPQSVDAYYDNVMNSMNFPAGVLLPPLFDLKMDDAPNYGNTGATIGHELVHGFDDTGRMRDRNGTLNDWWSAADAREFESRVECISKQFSQYTVVDDTKLNGRLVLGESVADLGGLIIAWTAWQELVKDKNLPSRDGLTPQQRFFVGFAQWSCAHFTPELLRLSARTNKHPPSIYRINGVVSNMPEFARAFSCKPGTPMAPKNVCRVW